MSFLDNFKTYKKRILSFKANFADMTEEATKNALVMPFFSMMGYDVFDPTEFLPEFVCDVGTKKGEKIDYAIMRDGEPIMLIEAKRSGMKLQKQQHSQLFRYFAVNRSRIAILTNGIQYNFYSDFDSPNVMDSEPFFSFNIIDDDEALYIQTLEQFTKEKFDLKNILSKAVFLKYAKVVEQTILTDLENPSDELVKYFLTRPEIKPNSRITSHTIEKYREITAKTIRKMMGITITSADTPKTLNAKPAKTKIEPQNTEDIVDTTETVVEEPTVIQTTATPEPIETPDTVAEAQPILLTSIEQVKEALKDYSYQEEDNPNFLRLHVYTSNNQKLGIIKMLKSDMKFQLKLLGNPTFYEISTAEQIKEYFQ